MQHDEEHWRRPPCPATSPALQQRGVRRHRGGSGHSHLNGMRASANEQPGGTQTAFRLRRPWADQQIREEWRVTHHSVGWRLPYGGFLPHTADAAILSD